MPPSRAARYSVTCAAPPCHVSSVSTYAPAKGRIFSWFQTKNVQPPDHHHTVADSAQMMADSANGGELRRSPWRFGMVDMA
ncbi:hypothetical protein ES332_A03G166700v1 [Gossypium tomentosum]|uniref:Uncharacterized protein n=1 Tax=Gossypium tomentosum TaxID=34277 RepID=A0A5D2RAP4_GOSTO|nr:hypothetical protein ES332_A03G166700v1 [Gossypium tomentosum]